MEHKPAHVIVLVLTRPRAIPLAMINSWDNLVPRVSLLCLLKGVFARVLFTSNVAMTSDRLSFPSVELDRMYSLTLRQWKCLCHRWSRDKPQSGSFSQRQGSRRRETLGTRLFMGFFTWGFAGTSEHHWNSFCTLDRPNKWKNWNQMKCSENWTPSVLWTFRVVSLFQTATYYDFEGYFVSLFVCMHQKLPLTAR